MQQNRRQFLQQAGLLAGSALALSNNALANAPEGTFKTFGLQLYSVRDVLPKDPKGVMDQLAKMGYKEFESYGGAQGFLWGMTPKEIKRFLGDRGVRMVSTHFDINKDVEKSLAMGAEAGLTYMLCPYLGPQKSWDDWKRKADLFNEVGEKARRAGVQFGYHNHDYSFRPTDGKLPQDYLLANTDPKNVIFELDLCWVQAAGQDAVAHLKQYAGRYKLCHIKDYKLVGGNVVQQNLGEGILDWKKILRGARQYGVKHFLVEQEQYPKDPLASMATNAAYMKRLTV